MNQGSQRPCSLSMKKVPCLVHHQEEIQLLPLLHQLLLLTTTYVLVLSGRGRTRRIELRPREPASQNLFFSFSSLSSNSSLGTRRIGKNGVLLDKTLSNSF